MVGVDLLCWVLGFIVGAVIGVPLVGAISYMISFGWTYGKCKALESIYSPAKSGRSNRNET